MVRLESSVEVCTVFRLSSRWQYLHTEHIEPALAEKAIEAHEGQLLCDIPLSIVCFWQMQTLTPKLLSVYQTLSKHLILFLSYSLWCNACLFGLFRILHFETFGVKTITFAVFDHVDVPVCCVFAFAGFCQQTGWVHLLAERRSRNHRQLDTTQSWYRQPQTLPGNSPCELMSMHRSFIVLLT